jgi:hypothetical protein
MEDEVDEEDEEGGMGGEREGEEGGGMDIGSDDGLAGRAL